MPFPFCLPFVGMKAVFHCQGGGSMRKVEVGKTVTEINTSNSPAQWCSDILFVYPIEEHKAHTMYPLTHLS